MAKDRKVGWSRALLTFKETFGLSSVAGVAVILFVTMVIVAAVFWFIHSAPPRTLTITAGPPGSAFEHAAQQYRDVLSSNGVTLKILTSKGATENLERLANRSFRVEAGFIQAGQSKEYAGEKLFSLGTVSDQPLLIFYRASTPVDLISDFAGKRLAIGPPGSGTRTLALMLLETNGVSAGGATTFLDTDSAIAAKDLLDGKADAVFLMGDSASAQTMRALLHSPGIQLFDFSQADAYTRRFSYLNKLQLPKGSIDFGKNIPPRDVNLIGPAVDLIAREDLHPALSDLLIEAAREVNGKATLLHRANEFPVPLEHEFKMSPDATRYYTSGKSFFYRNMPFWLASLVNRALVAFVPIIVLIPGIRLVPMAFRWRSQLRIYRWYRSLLRVERELAEEMTPRKRDELQERVDEIETSVNRMKLPVSFAVQFYNLREHVGFVRERLNQGPHSD